jgi:hypothetical protein
MTFKRFGIGTHTKTFTLAGDYNRTDISSLVSLVKNVPVFSMHSASPRIHAMRPVQRNSCYFVQYVVPESF